MSETNELQVLRHSAAHVMAQAVKRLFPEVKLTIGPAIDNGFYYDFDTEHAFTREDLDKIEAEMKKIAKENLKIERFELPRDKALELMKDEPYKIELINDIPDGDTISFYKQGEFTDLCAGPHVKYTSKVKAFRAAAGQVVEVYETTLHYAPCSAKMSDGFKVVIALPKGTNGAMPNITPKNDEDKWLRACNKWLLAHKDASEAGDGAYIGLTGENIDIAADID